MPAKRKSGKPGKRKDKRGHIRKESPPRNQSQDQGEARRPYRPHLRIREAVEIMVKAQNAQDKGSWETAISRFEKSNHMLQGILDDVENGAPFLLDGMDGTPEECRDWIRSECLRDMAINCQNMLHCARMGKFPDRIQLYRKRMLEYWPEYDRLRDTRQSKLELLQSYGAATASLILEDKTDVEDPALFVDCGCSYLTVLEEAQGKGWQITDDEIGCRQEFCDDLSLCLTQHPETGDRAVDPLLEAVNRSKTVNDFGGFYFLTRFLGDLYDIMIEKGCFWKGSKTSLEELYAVNIAGVFENLLRQGRYDPLLEPGENLMRQYSSLKSFFSLSNASSALSNYVDVLIQLERRAEAVKATEAVLNCSMGPDGPICPPLQWQNRLGRHIALLLQTGQLAQAEKTVKRWMDARKETLRVGYTSAYQEVGISKERYRLGLEEENACMFIYLAMIASCNGRRTEARQCLQQAKDYLQKHPNLNRERPQIARQILDLEKNGLPGDPAHS